MWPHPRPNNYSGAHKRLKYVPPDPQSLLHFSLVPVLCVSADYFFTVPVDAVMGVGVELRLKEHQRAVKSGQTTNGIAVQVQEAVWIWRTNNTMNLDQGLQLNPI